MNRLFIAAALITVLLTSATANAGWGHHRRCACGAPASGYSPYGYAPATSGMVQDPAQGVNIGLILQMLSLLRRVSPDPGTDVTTAAGIEARLDTINATLNARLGAIESALRREPSFPPLPRDPTEPPAAAPIAPQPIAPQPIAPQPGKAAAPAHLPTLAEAIAARQQAQRAIAAQ